MNPLLQSPSLSELSTSVTIIRSLGLTTKNLTHKKLNSILNLKNSVNILVDSKVTETEADQICNNDFKYLLRDYKHTGTLTKIKGILVIFNKSETKIKNLKVIREGQLLEFSIKCNNIWVNVVACYAPPDIDDPSFFTRS